MIKKISFQMSFQFNFCIVLRVLYKVVGFSDEEVGVLKDVALDVMMT